MADVTKTKVTAAEFFELPESVLPIELFDGEIIVSPTPIVNHQRFVLRIARLVEDLKPDGEVFPSPLDVHLDDLNVVQPDVMWISAERSAIIGEKRITGAPDLVVEIFSPGTLKRDRMKKFELYERYGAREYWMIDPEHAQMEVWVREGDEFVRLGVYTSEDAFSSPALGQDVPLDVVFG